ncbi:MAG: hypothetical protein MUC88_07545 [Planctomycetes bacterium]|nr:hypothetical protein [Planctomycetota bacterium]
MALPLSGAAPVPLQMDVRVPGKISYWQLSPGFDYLLFCVSADEETYDIWVAPVSWKQMRTTGPAALVFKNWGIMPWGGSCTPGIWSPDGKKIAIMQRETEIWIASPEGGEPRQLTGGPGLRGWPPWSPDSEMIAFYLSQPTGHSLQVIPASGGEAKMVTQLDLPGGGVGLVNGRFRFAAWSPDGRALTVTNRGGVSSVAISDGQSQPLVNAADIGMARMDGLRWSPDGKSLAFKARKPGESASQLFLFHSQDGHVTKVADRVPGGYFWSPDSQWISYYAGSRFVKTRREGVLWEMDIEEAFAKLAK